MEIFIPHLEHRRALILVDLQPGFVTEQNKWIIPNIAKIIQQGNYTVIVEAVFYADSNSLWDKQLDWTFPLQPTVSEISTLLSKDTVQIIKNTKSAFKGNKPLSNILKEKDIEENHIVGIDTEDCVLATAQESFDLGFYTYVLEECTESSQDSIQREQALSILRCLHMTNHSPN